jgi:uncharacterized protein (DUF58 family)
MAAAPWLAFAALLLVAAFLAWRLLSSPVDAPAEAPREELPLDVEARSLRMELAAEKMADSPSSGSFRSRIIARGGQSVADYAPYAGEDFREVDQLETAKRGEPYVRKYDQEREMPLTLVVDISRSGGVGSRGRDKRSVIEDIAGTLMYYAQHQNIRTGLVLVSDRVELVIPPKVGSGHVAEMIEALLKTQPSGAGTDLRPGLELAADLSRSRGMVVVVSDFIAPDFTDPLGQLSAQHDVRVIRVSDPRDEAPLPDVGAQIHVVSESGRAGWVYPASRGVRTAAAAAIARRRASREHAFEEAGLAPVEISTVGDPLETLELELNQTAATN